MLFEWVIAKESIQEVLVCWVDTVFAVEGGVWFL